MVLPLPLSSFAVAFAPSSTSAHITIPPPSCSTPASICSSSQTVPSVVVVEAWLLSESTSRRQALHLGSLLCLGLQWAPRRALSYSQSLEFLNVPSGCTQRIGSAHACPSVPPAPHVHTFALRVSSWLVQDGHALLSHVPNRQSALVVGRGVGRDEITFLSGSFFFLKVDPGGSRATKENSLRNVSSCSSSRLPLASQIH